MARTAERSALHRTYRALRGRDLPDDLPADVLLATAARSAVGLSRGYLAGARYGESGSLHLRGKSVTVRNPRLLRVGRGVIFNDGVLVDAFAQDGIVLGDRVTVARNASILGSGVIREPGVGIAIGSDTAVGMYNVIWGQGGVVIGKDCLLAPHVVIVSENHGFADLRVPIREQAPRRARVVIGDDCWLGAGVTVAAGVEIGSGSVIGAGAVVTSSLPANSIAVGVPARVVGSRESS